MENLPVIQAIPGQIHQLFQNLISNSIKFNTTGAPLITISHEEICEADAQQFGIDPKEFTCVRLSDNGIGFDEQYKEKIFGIFQRLSVSEFEGTGIGLAICKKIIDNHNGYIKAEGTPGKGAAFTIFLPNLEAIEK
jgi:two-component system CheB/CheR fusion protein